MVGFIIGGKFEIVVVLDDELVVRFYCFFGDKFVCDSMFELLDRGGCEGELELVFEGLVELVIEFDEVGLW